LPDATREADQLGKRAPGAESLARAPTRRELRLAGFVGLTILLGYATWLLVRPFLSVLVWASVLALLVKPLQRRLAQRLRRPGLAAGIAVAAVTVALVAPAILVTATIGRQAVQGAKVLRAEYEQGRWRAVAERHPTIGRAVTTLAAQVRSATTAMREAFSTRAPRILTGWARGAMELLVTLFALFFLLRDAPQALALVHGLLPLSETEADSLVQRVADVVWATTYGTIVVAAVQGTLGGLMFWWLGLPAPFLWGVVMGLLAVVPVLGAFVVWVPAAVFLALEGSWLKALILVAWGGIVIALIDNLLYPALVGKRLRLHTLPVLIVILGGLSLFGAAGLVIGPAVLTATVEVIRIWRRKTRARSPAAP
jgi:predicted PurR-regulated permease PerM